MKLRFPTVKFAYIDKVIKNKLNNESKKKGIGEGEAAQPVVPSKKNVQRKKTIRAKRRPTAEVAGPGRGNEENKRGKRAKREVRVKSSYKA